MTLNENELFSLKWGEFQPFISNSVRSLREVRDFTDVTLVSEDYVPFFKLRHIWQYISKVFMLQVGDFTDVTLVCEDGELEAHRVILSACSSFFQRVRFTDRQMWKSIISIRS